MGCASCLPPSASRVRLALSWGVAIGLRYRPHSRHGHHTHEALALSLEEDAVQAHDAVAEASEAAVMAEAQAMWHIFAHPNRERWCTTCGGNARPRLWLSRPATGGGAHADCIVMWVALADELAMTNMELAEFVGGGRRHRRHCRHRCRSRPSKWT